MDNLLNVAELWFESSSPAREADGLLSDRSPTLSSILAAQVAARMTQRNQCLMAAQV